MNRKMTLPLIYFRDHMSSKKEAEDFYSDRRHPNGHVSGLIDQMARSGAMRYAETSGRTGGRTRHEATGRVAGRRRAQPSRPARRHKLQTRSALTFDPRRPQPLLEHLDELRGRLITCLIWMAVFSVVCFFFVDPILAWLAKPVGSFIFTAPTEAFFVHLQVAFGLGTVLDVPVIIYEMWQFIGQGLRVPERRVIVSIIPAALTLFFVGMVIAVFLVVPAAMGFLLSYGSPTLRPMISLSE